MLGSLTAHVARELCTAAEKPLSRGVAAGDENSSTPEYGTSRSGHPLCTRKLGQAPPPQPPPPQTPQKVSVPQTWPPPRQRQLGRPPRSPPSSMHGARRVASDAAAPQGPHTTPRHTTVTQTYRGRGEHVSRSGAARGSPTSARAAAPRTASRGWPPPRPMDCTGRVALAGFPTMVRLSAERVPLWLDPTARSGGGPSMPSRPCWPLACHPTGREEANSVERHQAAAAQFRTRGPTSPARSVSVRTKKVKRSP